jgi:hypothetical protein
MGMCGKVCDKKGNAKIVKKRKSNLDVKKESLVVKKGTY